MQTIGRILFDMERPVTTTITATAATSGLPPASPFWCGMPRTCALFNGERSSGRDLGRPLRWSGESWQPGLHFCQLSRSTSRARESTHSYGQTQRDSHVGWILACRARCMMAYYQRTVDSFRFDWNCLRGECNGLRGDSIDLRRKHYYLPQYTFVQSP